MKYTESRRYRLDVLIALCNGYHAQFSTLQHERSMLIAQHEALKIQMSAVRRILKYKHLNEVTRQAALAQYPDLEELNQQRQEVAQAREAHRQKISLFLSQNKALLPVATILQRTNLQYVSIVSGILPKRVSAMDVIVDASHERLDLYYGGENNTPLGKGHGHIILDDRGVVAYHRYPGV